MCEYLKTITDFIHIGIILYFGLTWGKRSLKLEAEKRKEDFMFTRRCTLRAIRTLLQRPFCESKQILLEQLRSEILNYREEYSTFLGEEHSHLFYTDLKVLIDALFELDNANSPKYHKSCTVYNCTEDLNVKEAYDNIEAYLSTIEKLLVRK